MSAEPTIDRREAELRELRARVARLEAELAEQSRLTAVTVARAQEKLYWLERWQVDLDVVMRKRGAVPTLEALRRLRGVIRAGKKLKRRSLAG